MCLGGIKHKRKLLKFSMCTSLVKGHMGKIGQRATTKKGFFKHSTICLAIYLPCFWYHYKQNTMSLLSYNTSSVLAISLPSVQTEKLSCNITTISMNRSTVSYNISSLLIISLPSVWTETLCLTIHLPSLQYYYNQYEHKHYSLAEYFLLLAIHHFRVICHFHVHILDIKSQ